MFRLKISHLKHRHQRPRVRHVGQVFPGRLRRQPSGEQIRHGVGDIGLDRELRLLPAGINSSGSELPQLGPPPRIRVRPACAPGKIDTRPELGRNTAVITDALDLGVGILDRLLSDLDAFGPHLVSVGERLGEFLLHIGQQFGLDRFDSCLGDPPAFPGDLDQFVTLTLGHADSRDDGCDRDIGRDGRDGCGRHERFGGGLALTLPILAGPLGRSLRRHTRHAGVTTDRVGCRSYTGYVVVVGDKIISEAALPGAALVIWRHFTDHRRSSGSGAVGSQLRHG